MFYKSYLKLLPIIMWGSLGFKRGLDSYDHPKPSLYFYKNKIIHGVIGSIFYINPIMLFFTINKELYRIEVNLRNLEEEKQKNSYYDIF